MAPLTWKNVEAPNFAGSTQALAVASDALTSGVTLFGNAIDKYQANRRRNLVDQDMAKLATYGSEAALQAAVSNGSLGLQTSEAATALMDQRRALLGDDVTRGQIAANGLRMKTGEFELGRAQIDAGRVDERFAAQKDANPIIAKAYALADSGDYNGANKLILDNGELFAKAGIDGVNALSNNRSAVGAGQAVRKNTIDFNEYLRGVNIRDDSRELINRVTANGNFQTVDQAKQGLIDLRGKVPNEVIQGAIAALDQVPFDPAAAVDQQLGAQLPGTNAPARQMDTSWVNGPSGSKTPSLSGLLTKHEGAGKTDTLFGHAQKPGGAFEGVDVSKMTIGEVLDFQRPDGPYAAYVRGKVGRTATPVGALQIVGTTLRAAAKEMGLSADTPFNAQTQQALFNHLADKRLSGPRSMEGKMAGMRAEWEGFKNVSDKDLSAAITAYESGDKTALTGFTDVGNQGENINPLPTTGAGFSTLSDPSMGLSSRMDQLLADAGTPLPTSAPISSGSSRSASTILNDAANGGNTPPAATGVDAPITKGEVANQARVDRLLEEVGNAPEATIALPTPEADPNRTVSITEVNPQDTQFRQDVQSLQRSGDISGAVRKIADRVAVGREGAAGGIAGRALGSAYDYFMADPATAQTNATAREQSAAALDYWKSADTQKYFKDNPDQLQAAAQDPIAFANQMLGQEKAATPVDRIIAETSKPAPATDTIERPKPTSQASVPDMIRRARSTLQVDRTNSLNGSISRSLSDPNEEAKSVLDVSNELKTKGLSVNDTDREDAIARLSQDLNINPATAGILIQNSIEDTSFFGGLFGKESGINIDRAKDLYKQYQNGSDISKGVSIQETAARKAEVEKTIAETEALYTNVEAIYKQRLVGASPEEKKQLKEWYDNAQKAIKLKLEAINATGMLETYSRGKTSD